MKQEKFIIELYPKRYDLHIGQYGDKVMTETMKDLMEQLVSANYLSEAEFLIYSQTHHQPYDLNEVRLIFESKKKKKKGVEVDD